MIFYAIRDKRNGGYLPQMPTGRGMTHREAIPPSVLTVVPRLFKSRHAAECALRAWLAGIWRRDYRPLSDAWGMETEDNSLVVEKRHGRKRENMEIVEINVP